MSVALWVATALTTGIVIGAATTAYLDRERARKLRDLIDWLGEGLEARKFAELRHATFEDPTATEPEPWLSAALRAGRVESMRWTMRDLIRELDKL